MRHPKNPFPLEEWDFRRCPENERAACLHYEYAREYVRGRPELRRKLTNGPRPSPYDRSMKFTFSAKAHPDSLPMICPLFPDFPWLGLLPGMRTDLIALCQLLPEKDASNSNLIVEDDFDVVDLQKLDELRAELFSKWLQDERDRGDRESNGLIRGESVVEEPIERPPLCNGPKRYYAVDKFTAIAVIRLDYRKSKNELRAAFSRLLERGPKNVTPLGRKSYKGGRDGASDQLNALGAKRLLAHDGSSENAVEGVERVCYEYDQKPSYTDADALQDAASKAEKVLEGFKAAGRFRAFSDL